MEIPGSSSLGHTKLFAGLQRLGLSEGYFVIFDRRSQAPEWALRMRTEAAQTASSMAVRVLVLIG